MTFNRNDKTSVNSALVTDANKITARQEIYNRLSKVLGSPQNDPSVPGASRDGRYAVHCIDHERGGKSLIRCNSPKDAEEVAKVMILDNMGWIEGVYDLDTLTGETDGLIEDDVVMHNGVICTVTDVQEEFIEGEIGRYLCLKEGRNPETEGFDDWDHRIHEDDVSSDEIVERQYEDDRLPVRYGVSRVVVAVSFNTVAS